MMIYDVIVLGGGASGLFSAAAFQSRVKGLILEKSSSPGRKLLMSGSSQCNFTHGGSIKDFISHYGENGTSIRSLLYGFNNKNTVDFFNKNGVKTLERSDGKIFPQSSNSNEILACLLTLSKRNGFDIHCSSPATMIQHEKNLFRVKSGEMEYKCKKLIIATGGASYPGTGSDGSFFKVLSQLGLSCNSLTPALTPVWVKDYPYNSISGISIKNVSLSCNKNFKDDLLFTHDNFSGPIILNSSRYLKAIMPFSINYLPGLSSQTLTEKLFANSLGNPKNLLSILTNSTVDYNLLPLKFLKLICKRLNLEPLTKSSQIPKRQFQALAELLTSDDFIVSKLEGFDRAMVTNGGIHLSNLNLKTLETKDFPGLYIIGEALDVDGDTGGYNLQFAFSSGYAAAKSIIAALP